MLLTLVQICLTGCSSDIEDFSSCKLIKRELIFTVPQNQSRGLISEFPDSAELFIKFKAKKSYSWMKAMYSASKQKWIVEFPEEILAFGNGSCKVVYADRGNFTINTLDGIELDENTSIMMAEDGVWNAYENVIAVTAHLEPAFSRIRFVSDNPMDIWVKGFGLPYIYHGSSYLPNISSTYPESAPCYPKYVSVRQEGEDGKFYSEYYYTHTTKCQDFHTTASTWASSWEYIDCPENLKLSIFYPSETTHYYHKGISEFKAGESYLVKLPSASNYSGWTRSNNVIRTISTEIKIGDGSNTDHTYSCNIGSVIYGKFVNFEISSNGGDGYVSISGTNFSWKPLGAYYGKKVSAIYNHDYGFGGMTFYFNVSSLTKYYTIYKNVTLSQFPIYDLFENE